MKFSSVRYEIQHFPIIDSYTTYNNVYELIAINMTLYDFNALTLEEKQLIISVK